jgi:hypothetical protein
MRNAYLCLAALALGCGLPSVASAQLAQRVPGLVAEDRIASPKAEVIRQQVLDWAAEKKLDAEVVGKIEALWEGDLAQLTPSERLDLLAQSFALTDPRIAELVEYAMAPADSVLLPDFAWLLDENEPLEPFARENLMLYYGRWLAREQYFDEALAHLKDLEAAKVVDPATLLFYQAVTHRQLLNKPQGLAALDALLDDLAEPPTRYYALAVLMQNDLQQLEEESLDYVSRQMKDVEIRLDKGRAGKTVQVKSDEILDSLDQMIAKLEEQQQQQQQQGGGSGGQAGGIQSSAPAQDSSAAGGRGEGEVGSRDIGSEANWGNMDARDREQALQDVSESYPSYYREIVQEYFKRRAAGDGGEVQP